MEMSLDYLRKMAIDSVGRYSFLKPKDIEKAFGIKVATLQKDRQLGLISPISEETRIPEYDISEIEAYLIRKWKIVPMGFRNNVIVKPNGKPEPHGLYAGFDPATVS